MTDLQDRLAQLEGVPNIVPRYAVSQDYSHILIRIQCPSAHGEPRVQVESQAFGFVLDRYYLPLFLPDRVLTQVDVRKDPEQENTWILSLKKEFDRPFPNVESLRPEILPSEGIEALARAGEAQSPPPTSSRASIPVKDQQAAKDLLSRALQRENMARTSHNRPALMLTSDEEMTTVDAHRDAEGQLLRELRRNAAAGEDVSPSNSRDHPRFSTSRQGPRFGYGSGLVFDDRLPLPLVQLTKVYGLKSTDPSSLPLVERDRLATDDESKKWDAEYYMSCMIDEEGEVASLMQYELRPPRLGSEEPICHGASAPVWPEWDTKGDNAWRTVVEYESMLVSLLFAYAYDRRTTMDDPTVQSAWTISQLCRSLSHFAPAAGPTISSAASTNEVPDILLQHPLIPSLLASFRRSLTVPLYRSYDLSSIVVQDVAQILESGLDAVKAALVAIRSLFVAASGEDDRADDQGTILPDQDPFLLVYVRVAIDPLLQLVYSDKGSHVVSLVSSHLNKQLSDEDWDPQQDLFKNQVGALQQWNLLGLDALIEETK